MSGQQTGPNRLSAGRRRGVAGRPHEGPEVEGRAKIGSGGAGLRQCCGREDEHFPIRSLDESDLDLRQL